MKTFFYGGLVLLASIPFAAATPQTKSADLPLTFEPNRGQAEQPAQFIARGAGYYLTLGPEGSRMLLRSKDKRADVRMRLASGAASPALAGSELLPGHSAYFRGNDRSRWLTGVANYGRVSAEGVYPGIDLVYRGSQSHLEYDFVVAPLADPNRIRLRFEGVTGLRTDAAGNLVLATEVGNLLQRKPVIYQTRNGVRQLVEGRFVLRAGNTVSFALGRYDRTLPLVIDPVLVYSTFLGGADTDEGHAVAADGAANTYMVGITFSTALGDSDVLVRKISPDGTTVLYTADLGGSDNDYGNSIALDVNGYAFVGGRTSSLDFPMAEAFQDQNYGFNNAYVLRLAPDGNSLIFSTYVGGSDDDRGYAVAVDPQGSVYLAGAATSSDFPTNDGALQRTLRGGTDVFVIKFAYNGEALYGTLIGGRSDDIANAIAVDAAGNVYLAGDTYSDGFPQVNPPFQHSRHGNLEGFVSQLSPDFSRLIFSTFIGGKGDDSATGVAVDLSGKIYVVGSTAAGQDFNFPGRSFANDYNGGSADIFVAKYTANGENLAWTTFLGSHGGDYGNAIAVDPAGNVYVAGDTDSNQFPVTSDATQGSRAGGVDAVLSVLDTNGLKLLYSTFYGGSGDDSAYGIALDQYAEVYLTGATASGDLLLSQGALQAVPGGGSSDAFVAKFSVYGSAIPGATPSSNPAPATVTSVAPTVKSAFGRGMVASTRVESFRKRLRTDASVQPERFHRMSRSLEGSVNR